MNVFCFDLEMNQPSNKIIEFGWCVGNTNNGQILQTGYSFHDPGEELNPDIIKLCNITPKMIEEGARPLKQIRADIIYMHERWGCFTNPLVWGHGDVEVLRAQVFDNRKGLRKEDGWMFGRRIIDCKTLYQAWRAANNKKLSGGLGAAKKRLGGKFEGTKHRAVDDAINTFQVYFTLLGKLKDAINS